MTFQVLKRLLLVAMVVVISQYIPLKELIAKQIGNSSEPVEIQIPKPKPQDVQSYTRSDKSPANFRKAKEALRKNVYFDYPKTLYCGCDIVWKGVKGAGAIDHDSCGFQIRKDPKRSARVEWEHIYSASEMAKGRNLACWAEGGRKQCQKDPEYLDMASNLHNLAPAIGSVNADRSNFEFSSWTNNYGKYYGQCDMKVDFKGRRVSPPEEARGQISRAILYMADTYQLELNPTTRLTMQRWHEATPPSNWECIRDQRIASIQGEHNHYVQAFCN